MFYDLEFTQHYLIWNFYSNVFLKIEKIIIENKSRPILKPPEKVFQLPQCNGPPTPQPCKALCYLWIAPFRNNLHLTTSPTTFNLKSSNV